MVYIEMRSAVGARESFRREKDGTPVWKFGVALRATHLYSIPFRRLSNVLVCYLLTVTVTLQTAVWVECIVWRAPVAGLWLIFSMVCE